MGIENHVIMPKANATICWMHSLIIEWQKVSQCFGRLFLQNCHIIMEDVMQVEGLKSRLFHYRWKFSSLSFKEDLSDHKKICLCDNIILLCAKSLIRVIREDILYNYGALCFQFTHFSCDDWENIYTLSYYHHQIGSMNYYPLFRVKSWNNGMRCMPLYILMIHM